MQSGAGARTDLGSQAMGRGHEHGVGNDVDRGEHRR
jgi:hypothetical protein